MRRTFAIVLIIAMLLLSISILVLAMAIFVTGRSGLPADQTTTAQADTADHPSNAVPPAGSAPNQTNSWQMRSSLPRRVVPAEDTGAATDELPVTQPPSPQRTTSAAPAGAAVAEESGGERITLTDLRGFESKPPANKVVPTQASEPSRDSWITALPTLVTRTPHGLSELDRNQLIGRLTITGDQFTNRSLRQLAGLQVLSISIEAVHVNNGGLVHLLQLPQLREVRLWTPGVTDAGLEQLAQLGDLQLLDLEGTSVRGSGLADLKGLSKLRQLTMSSLSQDGDLAVLAKLPQVEELDLRPCRLLSDACIAVLAQQTQLRSVWLPEQVGKESKLEVRRQLSHCQVSW